MCDQPNCTHTDDLDDDISDIFGGEPLSESDRNTGQRLAQAAVDNTRRFEVKCKACKGSGNFVSYSGRVVGQCFKCKGKGKIYTKTDPAVLAERREKAKSAKRAKVNAWMAAHELEFKWMAEAMGRGFEFADAMLKALTQYGTLTEKQLAAVRKCMASDKARAEKREQVAEAAVANAATIEASKVQAALEAAHQSGLKWPKLRLGEFTFSRAGDSSANAGATYVKQGSGFDAPYMGKIVDGRFIRGRDCTDEQEAAILELAANPEAGAEAYGQLTGSCSCCGKKLTAKESVERSIGPVCFERFFGEKA